MDSNKTIRHLFSMDKKRFLTYERKLLDLAPTADEMLKDLNRPEALDEAGRRDLAIGAGLVVVAGLLATLSVAFGSLLIAGALTLLSVLYHAFIG